MFDAKKFQEALSGGVFKAAVKLAVEKAGGRCGEFHTSAYGLMTAELLDDTGKVIDLIYLGMTQSPLVTAPLTGLDGIGVMRCPNNPLIDLGNGQTVDTRQYALNVITNLQPGAVVVLSAAKDADDEYLCDFHIEGGPPGQVEVVHRDAV